jgi:Zn-dependent peptidase ImmA (M78 family)
MVRFRDLEILPISEGQDTPLVRRAVDHYAATLLMPEDLLKEALQGSDASLESTVRHLARRFRVSNSAMRIRLQEIGAARGASDSASIALQGTLF